MQLHVSLPIELPGTMWTVVVYGSALFSRHVIHQLDIIREVLSAVYAYVLIFRMIRLYVTRQHLPLITVKTTVGNPTAETLLRNVTSVNRLSMLRKLFVNCKCQLAFSTFVGGCSY